MGQAESSRRSSTWKGVTRDAVPPRAVEGGDSAATSRSGAADDVSAIAQAGGGHGGCLFCKFTRGVEQPGSRSAPRTDARRLLLHRDPWVAAFLPRDRCARNHVLVVPHVHIPDVNSLAADAPPVDPYSGPWGDAPVGLDGSGDGGAAAGAEQPDEADGAHRASGETGDTPMSHRKLVQHMRSVGAELLRRADEAQGIEHDPAGCVYRFHVPPFNSIAHNVDEILSRL